MKRLFADVYDQNADRYHAGADGLLYRHLARPLAEALTPAGGPALDVAGGTGALGRLIGADTALDISARQLRHHPARRRVHGDAERLPFRDDTFAVVGCSFGVNHFPDPAAAVREMARVAPVVGLLTWRRPEDRPYLPRQVIDSLVRPQTCAAARVAEELGANTGSTSAVHSLLAGAGLRPEVREVVVDVPWPGPGPFVDYRLALTVGIPAVQERVRERAVAAVAALAPEALVWRPTLVLGVGTRETAGTPSQRPGGG